MIKGDIDIDLGDRDKLLSLISHTPAAIRKENIVKKHPTGIYVTDIPFDPINNISCLDYEDAEERKYYKLDVLNVHIYNQIRDENHLLEMMKDPDWSMLKNQSLVEKLIHIGNHYSTIQKMPEPIDSIPRLAMFLAVMRPGKKHLIGLSWKEVSKTIWDKEEGVYSFKKSHAIAYAHLVVVNMNLLKYEY